MIPKGRCIQLKPYSNIIVMEDLSVWEMIEWDMIENEGEEYVIPIPEIKANINFEEWYGDDGKCNWFNDHLPVIEKNGKLIWNY